jgi:hypothetical protein
LWIEATWVALRVNIGKMRRQNEDEQDHDVDRAQHGSPLPAAEEAVGVEVHREVGQPQHEHDREKWVVAPVPRGDKCAPDHERERRQEGEVGDGDDRPGQHRHRHERHPAGDPQRDEHDQAATDRGLASGPVAGCGQQEARDHGDREAEHHLVRVPVHRPEIAIEPHHTGEREKPQHDDERGEAAREQEERAEALGHPRRDRLGGTGALPIT